MTRLRLGVSLLAFTAGMGLARPSLASKACDDTYVAVQRLRVDGKFVDARPLIESCLSLCSENTPAARSSTADCLAWAKEDLTRTPSVVISAKDGAQNDLAAVEVTIDGKVIATSLTGQPIPLNAGPHTIVLAGNGGRETRTFMAVESERRTVSVVLGALPTTLPTTAKETSKDEPRSPRPADAGGGTPTLKIVGYVSGGLGLAGIGVGTYFGLRSLAYDKEAKCDAMNVCENPDSRLAAQSSVNGAIGGFVAGGALFVGGLLMVVASPSSSGKASANVARVRAAPMMGGGTMGVSLSGGW